LEVCDITQVTKRETDYIIKYNTIKKGYNLMLSYNDKTGDDEKGKRFLLNKRLSRAEKISASLKVLNAKPEFIEKMHAIKLENKELDHNGNELPIHIYNHTARGNPGFRVTVGKDGQRNEKSFTDADKTMDEKLESAKKALGEMLKSFDNFTNKREENVRRMELGRLDYDGITTLPAGVHRYKKSGSNGYFATIYKGDKVLTKRLSDSKITLAENLNKIKKWLDENKEIKEIKL
jgi:hypothetical protein